MLLLGVGLEVLEVIHGRVNAGLSCRIELARTFFLVFFFLLTVWRGAFVLFGVGLGLGVSFRDCHFGAYIISIFFSLLFFLLCLCVLNIEQ